MNSQSSSKQPLPSRRHYFAIFFCKYKCWHSFVNISEIYWQAIYQHSLGMPKCNAIYRIHSAGLQHFIAMHCWVRFNEYHTADKATIYKCTNFQHHLSLLLSAASTHTIKQYPATNPQPTSTLTTWLRKAFSSRRMFWTVWRDNISAIYRDRKKIYLL